MTSFMSALLVALSLIFCTLVSAQSDWNQFGSLESQSVDLPPADELALTETWRKKVGNGRSQVVGVGKAVYVASGNWDKKDGEGQTVLTTTISMHNLNSGELGWSQSFESTMHSEQETFGGAPASPQATPLVIGGRLFVLSFSGELYCLDRQSGETIWSKDLVLSFGSEPVQFGFTSSPVADSSNESEIVLLAAGQEGGLLNLDVASGKVNWQSECLTCSYATPVSANFGDTDQWVVVTETDVLGIGKSDGTRLWTFELTKPGLTNVPTPLILDESTMLISGQGVGGTRRIAIERKDDHWIVDELWNQPRLEFFYTNWMQLDDRVVVGCTDSFLAAIEINSGRLVGRWRGFGDGNLMAFSNAILILNGQGKLTVFDSTIEEEAGSIGLIATGEFSICESRCWTPVSCVGGKLMVRFEDELICLTASTSDDGDDQKLVENRLLEPKIYPLTEKLGSTEPKVDPVAEIFRAFENQGQTEALTLYSQFRSTNQLTVQQRLELVEAAKQQKLNSLAKMILQHAAADFPDSREVEEALQSLDK